MANDTEYEEQSASGFPATWIASEDGDEIAGKFVRLDSGFGKDGAECPIVVLEADGSEWGVWLWQKVLRNQFKRLRPKAGELVRVVYRGKRRGERFTYHDFDVTAPERESRGPDWDSLDLDPDEQARIDPSTAEIPF